MTSPIRWISSLALATAVSLASFTGSAAEPVNAGALTKTVKMWDLDLTKPADVQTLFQRVRTAATSVCNAEKARLWRNTRARAPAGWNERCVNDAVDGAVNNIGSSALAALR